MSDRFELLGMLGRGGTATVHLANDALRGHPVALKVVHPHLADDPAVQRRLRREVAAASLIQHEAALVPYDLHEVDGALALSMPWHPGETLAERVSRKGKLSPRELDVLARRLAGALSASHRAGVLHRDVTAANVLLEEAADAVLSDFGLARVTKTGTQATTGLLGTAGYAAPEVYSGSRADPRSDLYGLGATLYLAATGVPAFDPGQPVVALKAQLDDSFTPVRELAPKVPAPMALLIEQLLRADPAQRPSGAAEVIERLEGRSEVPAQKQAAPAASETALALPEGTWTVLVKETDADRLRREALRVEGKGARRRRATLESQLLAVGQSIAEGLREWVGWPPADAVTPEQLLVDAVAEEAGLAVGTLRPNAAMLDKKFRLVDRTDEPTVRRLARAAKDAGFQTEVHRLREPQPWERAVAPMWWIAMVPLFFFVNALPPAMRAAGWAVFGIGVALMAVMASRTQVQRRLAGRAIAFRAGTTLASKGEAAAVTEAPERPMSEGQRLRARAFGVLDGLDETLATDPTLPEAAKIDLRSTSKRLRASAESLAARHDALADTLSQSGSSADQVAGLAARLARLETLERAGRSVDAAERDRLTSALSQHSADEAAAERVESELIATQAQLLELCSTASRVRREIVQQGDGASADALVAQLQREAEAMDRARREASQRQRQ